MQQLNVTSAPLSFWQWSAPQAVVFTISGVLVSTQQIKNA
jgi:hypothetical protein